MKQITKKIATRSLVVERAIQTKGEDPNEITVIFSTGYKGLRSDWFETFYEQLEMTDQACDLTRLKSGAPFLCQHANSVLQTMGVVRDAWIENGIGYAKIKLSKNPEFANIVQDIQDEILNNVSVGYTVQNYEDVSEKDASTRTYLAKKWTPLEISLVAIGFDPNAQVTRQIEQQNEVIINTKENEMKFKDMNDEQKRAHIQSKLTAKTELDSEERAFHDEKMKTSNEPASAVDTEALKRQISADYKKKTQAINTIVRASGLDMKLAEQFINEDLSVEDVSTRIMEALEKNQTNKLTTQKKENQVMGKRELMVAAILNRLDAQKFKIDGENEYRGASLLDICKDVVPMNPGENSQAYAQRAIQTSDLTDLLSNVANKILKQDSAAEKYIFSKIAVEQPLRDMKATPIIQVGNSGLSEKASETGEYTEGTMTDSKETITLQDRGVIFKITYKAIVNDDLSVLKQIGNKAPLMGGKDLEKLVVGVLNANPVLDDTKTLFHADHNNLITGSAAPTELILDAIQQKMRAFLDESGDPMGLAIKYLVVPPSMELAAKKLVAAITPAQSSNVNPFSGTIEVLVSSLLTKVSLKDAYYAVCDPAEFAPLVYGTLEGQGAVPEVAVEENFATKGLNVRVTQPGAAAAASSKGIVRIVVA